MGPLTASSMSRITVVVGFGERSCGNRETPDEFQELEHAEESFDKALEHSFMAVSATTSSDPGSTFSATKDNYEKQLQPGDDSDEQVRALDVQFLGIDFMRKWSSKRRRLCEKDEEPSASYAEISEILGFLNTRGGPELELQKKNNQDERVRKICAASASADDEQSWDSAFVATTAMTTGGTHQGTGMNRGEEDIGNGEEEGSISALPEVLVEKIISAMPFPNILRARALSKSWYSNFSPNPESVAFQNEVQAISSSTWNHYCPIIWNLEEEWLLGFDGRLNQWQKLDMAFEKVGLGFRFSKLKGAGSLMCGVFDRSAIFVTNIVTRAWKWLSAPPNMEFPKELHLLPVGSDAYQVLLMTKQAKNDIICQVYDSRTQSWTERRSTVGTALVSSSSAYLNGVLYLMEYDPDDYHDIMKVLSYNVQDGTWKFIHHPFRSMLHEIETYELLVCQSTIMVVLHLHPTWWSTRPRNSTLRNTLMVYQLDPISLEIREIARGPPEKYSCPSTLLLFASDNDCIYFGNPQVENSAVVKLDVKNREWSCLPPPSCPDSSFKNKWGTFSFQPGLNPFANV